MEDLFTIRKAFNSPFSPYDVCVFGGVEFWAGEPFPASSIFADGQGPGLFMRASGDTKVPEAINGSETRRMYALTQFKRADGVKTLVGMGLKTADIFSLTGNSTDGYPRNKAPYAWSLQVPSPLYLFWSLDGVNWNDVNLGELEKGDGPYDHYYSQQLVAGEEGGLEYYLDNIQNKFMGGNKKFSPCVLRNGNDAIGISTGKNLVRWDGYTPLVTPVGTWVDGCVYLAGKWYFAFGANNNIATNGSVIVVAETQVNFGMTTGWRYYPQQSDAEITVLTSGMGMGTVVAENGRTIAIGRHGDRWVFFGSLGNAESGTQEFGALVTQTLPHVETEIDWEHTDTVIVDDSKLFLDLGTSGPGDTIVVRGSANGSIYLFQHKDMQDSGDRSKAEIAVFQVPVYEPPSQAMTVAVYAMRHKWGCSDTPWNLHVDAVRHLWSDGAGDVPQVLAIRHKWSDGSGSAPDVNSVLHAWLAPMQSSRMDALRHKWGTFTFAPKVFAMRHVWSDGSGEAASVTAARHKWSDGSGESPEVVALRHGWGEEVFPLEIAEVDAVRHLWAEGMTMDEGTKKVVFSHAFDADMTHVRLSPHRMSLQNAMNVQVGVRADSGLPKDRWSSYQPVRPLYNERLPEPGQDIDVLLIVPDGEIVGPMALTGHAET